MVAETPIDRQVPVDLWRNGKPVTVQVVVAEMPEDAKPAAAPDMPHKAPAATIVDLGNLGMKVAPMSEDLRTRFKLDEKQKGVVITDVTQDGTAADRGLKAGDVIVEVQQQGVFTPADIQKHLTDARTRGARARCCWCRARMGCGGAAAGEEVGLGLAFRVLRHRQARSPPCSKCDDEAGGSRAPVLAGLYQSAAKSAAA